MHFVLAEDGEECGCLGGGRLLLGVGRDRDRVRRRRRKGNGIDYGGVGFHDLHVQIIWTLTEIFRFDS